MLLKVQKAPLHDDTYHTTVILLLANVLKPRFKPVIVLTDMLGILLVGKAVRMALCSEQQASAGMLEDMLQQEELNNSAKFRNCQKIVTDFADTRGRSSVYGW